MNRPLLHAALFVAALGVFGAGCQKAGPGGSARKAKPDDPTAWSGKDLTSEDNEKSGPTSSLPKSSRLSGGLSDEARSVESSLGVGP